MLEGIHSRHEHVPEIAYRASFGEMGCILCDRIKLLHDLITSNEIPASCQGVGELAATRIITEIRDRHRAAEKDQVRSVHVALAGARLGDKVYHAGTLYGTIHYWTKNGCAVRLEKPFYTSILYLEVLDVNITHAMFAQEDQEWTFKKEEE